MRGDEKMGEILFLIIGGLIGYYFGILRSFREEKQRAYGEIIPPILTMAYNPEKASEEEYAKAMHKLWLFGSIKVALKVDKAVSIIHHPDLGNKTEALQETVVAMRNDIQIYWWQKRLKPEKVKHLYSIIMRERVNSERK